MSTSTLSVLRFREPNHYINSGTQIILEAADGYAYAIGRQVLPGLELVPLTAEEKIKAREMGLLVDDGSRLEQLQILIDREYDAKQHTHYITVSPDCPISTEQPGVYGVRKDGTRERIRDC